MLDEFSKMLDGFSKIASCRRRSTSVDICRQSENRRFFDVFLRFLISFLGRHFSYMGDVMTPEINFVIVFS